MAAPRQEIRFCTSSDGARIAYATAGKGPPLVTNGRPTKRNYSRATGKLDQLLLRASAIRRVSASWLFSA